MPDAHLLPPCLSWVPCDRRLAVPDRELDVNTKTIRIAHWQHEPKPGCDRTLWAGGGEGDAVPKLLRMVANQEMGRVLWSVASRNAHASRTWIDLLGQPTVQCRKATCVKLQAVQCRKRHGSMCVSGSQRGPRTRCNDKRVEGRRVCARACVCSGRAPCAWRIRP